MAAPDTSVKYYHSGMAGAPVHSGSVGALIGMLDACLVNGFGLVTLDSVVVTGAVATATRAAGISFEKDAVVLLAGAAPAGLNGEKRVLSITGTTFTFDATGISSQTATGTITAKVAPAGWEKQFSGTNLAAYRSTNVASVKPVLRVDDTAAQTARVVMYESMTSISTGTNPFPTNVQQSGGGYWDKADAASSASRKWIIVADDRAVNLAIGSYGASPDLCFPYAFGEHVTYKASDSYPGFLFAQITTAPGTSAPGAAGGAVTYPATYGMWLQRDATGLVTSVVAGYGPTAALNAAQISGGTAYYPPYPGTTHGSLVSVPVILKEGVAATSDFRGTVPGVLFLFSGISGGALPSRTKLTAEGALAGRVIYFFETASASSGRGAYDISGPWR